MAYVIANKADKKEYKEFHWCSAKIYDTDRGAKIACTKMNKKLNSEYWQVFEINDWNDFKKANVKMLKKVNLMSGIEYEEAEDTPAFMSPACESYWSM